MVRGSNPGLDCVITPSERRIREFDSRMHHAEGLKYYMCVIANIKLVEANKKLAQNNGEVLDDG
jgi:hypothetical protein